MTKPFLILQLRPEDEASHDEFEAFIKFGGLSEDEAVRVRMEQEGVPEVNLDDFAGIIVGGGPSNVSDPDDKKSDVQKIFETGLSKLLDEVVERDFPFLGACYGIGVLAKHEGGDVSKEKYGEDAGSVIIKLTDDGKKDPVTDGLPDEFKAFCGHKEACQDVPESATLLASSDACPVQLIRVGKNVYGAQFHPELDNSGLALRIRTYKDHGYFQPHEYDDLLAKTKEETVAHPMTILKNFVDTYRTT